jgi:alpha-glucosidase
MKQITSQASDNRWWKHGVIYQIYPRSYRDSNGDGIGDLPGMIESLDYLSELGIDGIWLSPIFASPMADCGYDVSDYCAIDPVYGTLDQFDTLVTEAHARAIRIILDLVPNHTSDRHPWFVDARSSSNSSRRDWYIWHPGRPRGVRRKAGHWHRDSRRRPRPPNNWRSAFGGSAWEWDETNGEYYLHSFLAEQPDLNWRNREVERAMFQEIEFWLDRGVDGFRLDVVNLIVKDRDLRSNPYRIRSAFPRRFDQQHHLFDRNQPESHEILRRLRDLTDQYGDTMMVGEILPDEGLPEATTSASYLGSGTDELHLAFNFDLMATSFRAGSVKRLLQRWYDAIPEKGWPCHVLNSHDDRRTISRLCRGSEERARLLAALLLTQRGTPFLYYGEEVGMRDGRLRRSELRDPVGIRYWPLHPGRDPVRTPMQWDDSHCAGFTTARPWLPVNSDYRRRNVAAQSADPSSLLAWYQALIRLRRESPALHGGSIRFLDSHPDVLAYERAETERSGERIIAMLNFASRGRPVPLATGKCLCRSTREGWEAGMSRSVCDGPLAGHEVRILRVSG